jgi:hypothetical protein
VANAGRRFPHRRPADGSPRPVPEATKRPFGCPLVPTRSRDLIQTQLAATARGDASRASGARRALTGQVRSIGDLKKAAGKPFVACGRP